MLVKGIGIKNLNWLSLVALTNLNSTFLVGSNGSGTFCDSLSLCLIAHEKARAPGENEKVKKRKNHQDNEHQTPKKTHQEKSFFGSREEKKQ